MVLRRRLRSNNGRKDISTDGNTVDCRHSSDMTSRNCMQSWNGMSLKAERILRSLKRLLHYFHIFSFFFRSFGKSSQTSMALIQLAITMVRTICSWNVLTSTTMKWMVIDMCREQFWSIWNQALWTPCEHVLTANCSDQTTLSMDNLAQVSFIKVELSFNS